MTVIKYFKQPYCISNVYNSQIHIVSAKSGISGSFYSGISITQVKQAIMKLLKTNFRLNCLAYNLLKRNEPVAIYGIGGTYTEKILHYEVNIIYIRKDQYGEREAIPSNCQFGRDRSMCFLDKQLALDYYDKLTEELYKGVPKVVSGVEEHSEVIFEYQMV